MYKETTSNQDLVCNVCNKDIHAGSKYFDDSVYNSLYAKIEIQKTLCFDCGSKYNLEQERRYQEHEKSQLRSRIVNVFVMLALFFLGVILLSNY